MSTISPLSAPEGPKWAIQRSYLPVSAPDPITAPVSPPVPVRVPVSPVAPVSAADVVNNLDSGSCSSSTDSDASFDSEM